MVGKKRWIPSWHLPVFQLLDGAGGRTSIPAHQCGDKPGDLSCACSDPWAAQWVGRASRSRCAHTALGALLTSPPFLCHQHLEWTGVFRYFFMSLNH